MLVLPAAVLPAALLPAPVPQDRLDPHAVFLKKGQHVVVRDLDRRHQHLRGVESRPRGHRPPIGGSCQVITVSEQTSAELSQRE